MKDPPDKGAATPDAMLPCPFCGYADVEEDEGIYQMSRAMDDFVAHCGSCGAEVSDTTEARARAKWNARASAPPQPCAPDDNVAKPSFRQWLVGLDMTDNEKYWAGMAWQSAERYWSSRQSPIAGHAVEAGALVAKPELYETYFRMWKQAEADLAAERLGREVEPVSFQARVQPWMMQCFGAAIAADRMERSDRFIEEALELVQACNYTKDRAHSLVEYVFNRPIGEPTQEVGGVMVTLAALCLAHGFDMHAEGERELTRINASAVIEKIRAKQAAKPSGSALPIAPPPASVKPEWREPTIEDARELRRQVHMQPLVNRDRGYLAALNAINARIAGKPAAAGQEKAG